MNLEKIGNFIASLRKEKGLSQQELADKLFVTREAISKWERGKNLPESSCLLEISHIFNVSINEILYGEKKSEENNQKVDTLTLDIYKERNKIIKYFKIIILILFIVILMFLGYYFINNYKTIKVYTIDYTDKNIDINDGIFVVTKDKIYFNLGELITKDEVKSLRLYELVNNEEKLVVEVDDIKIAFYDFYGYNAYFNYDNLDKTLNNLYLKIKYEEKEETIKLELKRDFVNSNIFSKKRVNMAEEVSEENVVYECQKYDSEILKEKLENESDGVYKYIDKNEGVEIIYFEEGEIIIINKIENELNKNWKYIITHDQIIYSEYIDMEDLVYLEYSKCKPNTKLNKEEEKIVNYFYKILDKIYES